MYLGFKQDCYFSTYSYAINYIHDEIKKRKWRLLAFSDKLESFYRQTALVAREHLHITFLWLLINQFPDIDTFMRKIEQHKGWK